jgi:hypothetical protein
MPTYQITGPDGTDYEIDGPEGATREQIIGAIQYQLEIAEIDRQAQPLPAYRPTEEEDGFFETIGKGVVEGYSGTIEAASLGAATLLNEEDELAARKIIQELGEAAKFESADRDSITYLISSGLGSFGAILTPVALAAAAPFSVTAAAILGTGGAATIGVAAGAGEASERARAAGATPEQKNVAALKGAFIGSLEVLPLGRILRIPGVSYIAQKFGGDVVEGLFGRIRSAAASGSMEAAQEVAAGILQNLTEQGYNPKKELLDSGLIDEAIAGGGAGAILQAVVDIATKGRTSATRGPGTPAESIQKELFGPDEDLGTLPPKGTQIDLFPQADESTLEELGIPPERADDRQLDLFGARSEPEGEQQELQFESVPGADAEQLAQAAARERAGLAAAARGDVTAFEQPDLFALQQEQENRRLGMPRLPVDQFMDVQEEAEIAPAPETGQQLELEDAIAERQRSDAETAQLEEMIAADERLRAESELETISGRLDTKQQQETAARRGAVLGSVLTDLRSDDPAIAIKRFSSALRKEGVANTAPTGPELRTINSATSVAGATSAPLEVIEPRQQYQMQEDAEGVRRRVLQTEVPFVPERVDPGSMAAATDTLAEPTPESETAAPEVLDPESIDAVIDEFEEPISRSEVEVEVEVEAVKAKVTPEAKKAPAKKAPAKKAAAKKTAAKKTETQKPLETRVDKDGNTVTLVPEGVSSKKKRKSSPKSKQIEIEVGEPWGVGVKGKDYTAAQPASVNFVVTSTDADVAKVNALVRSKRTRAEQRKESTADANKSGARKYFGRKDDPIEALDDIVYDLVYGPPKGSYRLRSKEREGGAAYTEAEQSYFKGRGKPAAREALSWVRDNLDPTTVKSMNDLIAVEIWGVKSGKFANLDPDADVDVLDVSVATSPMSRAFVEEDAKQIKSYVDAQLYENIDYLEGIDVEDTVTENDLKDLLLESGQVVGLDLPTHPVINNLLRAGKLKEALRTLAITSPSSRVSQVARTLAQKLGDTKVEVVENLTNDADKSVAGLFDPKTNTIKIGAATGINPHTILHETTHALTSDTLANKSHTATKQLEKLFNDVKDQLGSYYGSQNVDEFVAEAFGNPEFQQTLAGIIPNANYIVNGKPVNALQRFYRTVVNLVRNRLGMRTKPVDSVLDQVDQFIEAMLAPAPQFRNAGEMYEKIPSEIMDGLNKIGKSFPKLTPAYRKRWVNSVHNFFSTDNPVKGKAGDVLLMFAPLQALTDVAQRYEIKSAHKLHTAIQALVGAQSEAEKRVDATLRSMSKWLRAETTTDVQRGSFNNLVYDSTTEQVDPTKPRDRYKDNAKKLAVWDAMHKQGGDVSIVGKGGMDTYIELRDSYAKQFKELQSVIEGRINSLKDENGEPLAKEAKEKLKTTVFEKIFERGRIEPYFPLTRQGDLWIEFNTKVKDAQGEETIEPVYMAFRTNYERKQFKRSLEGNPDVVGEVRMYENIQEASKGARSGAPSTSFINATMKLLAGVDANVKDQFTQLFLNALPESSFAKNMVSRKNEGKGILGFDKDAESAFRFKAFDLASQIERMRHSQNIDGVMGELKAETKAVSQASNKGALGANKTFTELSRRADFAKNPPSDKLAASFNRIAFLGTIGFNVSSAIVNMSQIPLMMQPLLGGTYGQKEAFKALAHAGNLYRSSGIFKGARKLTTMLGEEIDAPGMTSIDNYYQEVQTTTKDAQGNETTVYSLKLRDDLKVDAAKRKELEDLMPLVQKAADQGQLSRSMFYDNLGLELSGREKGIWDYTNAMSAFMFHQVERANRQIAMVSTYQLELNRLREKGGMADAAMQDAAAQTAISRSQEMNGGAFLATAPRIAQKGVGRVASMYKTFGVQMYYTILKTGKAAFSNADPEIQKQAKKQLIGVLGSSMILAGVQGLPMIGAVFAIINMFRGDDEEDAETITRQFMGEGFYKGGINALTGMDVANRFGLGNLLFRMNPYSQHQSGADIVAQMVGGPAWSVISQFGRGMNDAANGELQRGIETMLPSAFRNIAKTFRYMQEGAIKSRRGDIIYDDISSGELMSQFFGFAPTGYTLQQEINMSTKKIDRAVNEQRTRILNKLYTALRMGDFDGFQNSLEEVSDFNERHPNFPLLPKTITKSIQTHGRTSATMHNGIIISPKMRGTLQEHRDDYWGQLDSNLLRLLD